MSPVAQEDGNAASSQRLETRITREQPVICAFMYNSKRSFTRALGWDGAKNWRPLFSESIDRRRAVEMEFAQLLPL